MQMPTIELVAALRQSAKQAEKDGLLRCAAQVNEYLLEAEELLRSHGQVVIIGLEAENTNWKRTGAMMVEMVRFECRKLHSWKDPMPTPEAPAMLNLFGICPVCPGRVQGTVKQDSTDD